MALVHRCHPHTRAMLVLQGLLAPRSHSPHVGHARVEVSELQRQVILQGSDVASEIDRMRQEAADREVAQAMQDRYERIGTHGAKEEPK